MPSYSYGASNSGTALITNSTNNRQLQMGVTVGGVWMEGWMPGIGGATMMFQPSGGPVAISTTTVTSGFRLEVGGAIRCTSLTQTSDRRAKESIVYLDGADSLEKIMLLKPCLYTLKKDHQSSVGLIADETEPVIPVAVNGNIEETFQGIDYTSIFSTLLSAVQELSKQIDLQAHDIQQIKNKVNL